MAFTVLLGTLDKRINSTKQPDLTSFTTYNVNLKQGTDLESPAFLLEFNSEMFPKYNYMYISDIGHYLWVTDIISVRRNLWEIRAYIDRLATYKSQIMATPAYIEYGFNEDASGSALRIPDTRQNISMAPSYTTSGGPLLGSHYSLTGTYILSAVGASGGVATYALDQGNLWRLVNTIGTDITDEIDALIDGITEPVEAIKEIMKYFTPTYLSQGSCIQAIRNCFWIPITLGSVPAGAASNIYLGDFNTGAVGHKLDTDTLLLIPLTIPIPWPVSDWRRMNCQLSMYVPYVGTVGIPVDQVNTASSLSIMTVVDCATGDFSITIETNEQYPVYSGSANIARGYPIGSSNVPATQFASGVIGAIGGVIQAGGGAIDTVYGIVSGSGSSGLSDIGEGLYRAGQGYVQSVTPVVQCAGNLTGSAANGQSSLVRLMVGYYTPVDDAGFSAVYGHPVFRVATPVSGYCKTRGFSLSASGRADDIGGVNTLMDSGVFIE